MNLNAIDADGHLIETVDQLAEFIDPAYREYGPARGARSYFPSDGWDRSVRGTLGRWQVDAQAVLEMMDEGAIETAVLYPTQGLGIGWIRDPDFAVALCRAYNDFFFNRYHKVDARLTSVALLPLQDVGEAIKELRRATGELGASGAMLPAVGLRKPLGHRDYWPIYQEAERLGCMLASHATVRGPHYFGADGFDTFIEVHTLSHAFAQMMQLTSMVFSGVPERFPNLRIGFMEAGCSWMPYWIDRMHEEWEKRAQVEAPQCRHDPAEYIRRGNLFFSIEAGEGSLAEVVRRYGDGSLVYATDFPHWDAEYPDNLRAIKEREDLSEESKRKILRDNSLRLYALNSSQPSAARATA
ncbi:MAG TPA: amidohydrolase family protein [Candidatus Binataceae bacterium]|nr:amidohydrolase family protein [Candidatus Binataceae bacterium]